jgi:short-subunit dehydrogenase
LLINNAGINVLESFMETKLENWIKIMNTNVTQVFIISQIIAKGMIKKKKGAIVNVSSQVMFLSLNTETLGLYGSH